MNRLSKQKSAYLKHAAHQKIDWYPWTEKAFSIARERNKPVFLSSGAVWCHWCHVMAKESFYDEAIADFLNTHFISIKLDRDERPDIDRRYQMAVSAMGAGGGWPLTVFLTPDKLPFYGGTYFPPHDNPGRPGFGKVLQAVHDLYHSKKDEISEYTGKLVNALKPLPVSPGDISQDQISEAVGSIISLFDSQHGGFGEAPKFPMAGAIDFLINRYYFTGDKAIGSVIRKTLDSMAAGGFYDQLGGGFHRYATDKAWIVPHFEKMADDNAWLLRNYLNAYAVFGDRRYREVAEGIIHFVRTVLSDPEGGFYASQDADVTPDDEGGYFTWRDEEVKSLLEDKEFSVLSLHLLHEAGAMHHDRSKKVLFIAMGARDIAEKTGLDSAEVMKLIKRGKEKLLRERNKRETPFIDTAFYTSINGMFISAFLHASRILEDRTLRNFALRSLEKTLNRQFIDRKLYHSDGVRAFLDDYISLIDALISAFEAEGEKTYVEQAEELMELCMDTLWDREGGGFFDTEDQLLGVGIKGIEEIPHPSANALGIFLLLKLSSITGKQVYRRRAEEALKAFSDRAREAGIHAGYFFSVVDAYFNPLKMTLHAAPGSALAEAALSVFRPYTDLVYDEDKGFVVPCAGAVCYEPLDSPEKLKEFMEAQKK